jgi:hypothetical protein
MLELGPDAPAFHAALAAPIEAADVDLVFCAGPMMKSLWDALPPPRRGGYAEAAADIAARARGEPGGPAGPSFDRGEVQFPAEQRLPISPLAWLRWPCQCPR